LYRALDVLPGGDVSLLDYCNALLVTDEILFGKDTEIAIELRVELRKRKIFSDDALPFKSNLSIFPEPEGGWTAILDSRQAACAYLKEVSTTFGIPDDLNWKDSCLEIVPEIQPHLNPKNLLRAISFVHQQPELFASCGT
jgi:hypothetical protein